MNDYIGIFDSGVGGLTVLKLLKEKLPNERFIYFGDTKNLPYGEKSKNAIIEYSDKICNFLIQKKCKAIVIACNSSSANAYDYLKEKYSNSIPIINVIDPTVNFICEKNYTNIGVIATRATIKSDTYRQKITNLNTNLKVHSLDTPLFVNLIEDGFLNDLATELIIEKYLLKKCLENIDSLILGCTHYPILENKIKTFYEKNEKNVDIINSAYPTSLYLEKILIEKKITSNKNNKNKNIYYISDYSEVFLNVAEIILQKKINIEVINI